MKQQVQVCAVCHSDPAFLASRGGHDPVASYLHSYHGKAQLLGDEDAATCVDCHEGENESMHAMVSKLELEPEAGAVKIETCRSARCHINASPTISSAAVHLDIDPSERSPEFYLASFFVLITVLTLTTFLIMIVFELIGFAVRPSDPHAHRETALARKVLATRAGRRRLRRLTTNQRFQHWLLAITFIILAITGMALKFADAAWAPAVVNAMGGLAVARTLHRIAGVVMLVGFAYHLIYLAVALRRHFRSVRAAGGQQSALKIFMEIGIIPNWGDVLAFRDFWLYLFFRRKQRPDFGRYTFHEKFEYWAVTWGCLVIGISGLALWASDWVTVQLSGRVLNFAFIIHSIEAFLAVVHVAVVHFYSVSFGPTVFPLSQGSLTGDAPPEWMAEWHGREVREAAAELGIEVGEVEDHGVSVTRRIYSMALAVVVAVVCYASTAYVLGLVMSPNRAPAEIAKIPHRLTLDNLGQLAARDPMTRGPLAHYHQMPPWYEADETNDCVTAGCHAALPHGDDVATRAFLNMHATYTDCRVCHVEQASDTSFGWFDPKTGAQRASPAVFRLERLLRQAVIDPADLRALLDEAVEDAHGEPVIVAWRIALETTRPDSPVWKQTVASMRRGIANHLHGEYGTKLAHDDGSGQRPRATTAQRAATEAFLEAPGLDDAARKRQVDAAHGELLAEPLKCTPCHVETGGAFNFVALGYDEARIRVLRASLLARRVRQIEEGAQFYMRTTPHGIH